MHGETRSWVIAFVRGALRRCPRCGQGQLFRLWFRIVRCCPRCDLPFERDEGSRLGSAMVNYAVVGFFLVAYIAVGVILTLPEPPLVPLVLGSVVLVVAVALFFFPFSKTLWSAIDLVLHGFVLDEEQQRR